MTILDNNKADEIIPPLDPLSDESPQSETVEEESDWGMFDGIRNSIVKWAPSIAFVGLGIVFIILAFLMTDAGKSAVKKAVTKGVME